MKKIYILALFLAILSPKLLSTEYTQDTIVVAVEKPNKAHSEGMVYCKSSNDIIYSFEGSEDWLEGDIAVLTISDNATFWLDDDKVVKAIYTGYPGMKEAVNN